MQAALPCRWVPRTPTGRRWWVLAVAVLAGCVLIATALLTETEVHVRASVLVRAACSVQPVAPFFGWRVPLVVCVGSAPPLPSRTPRAAHTVLGMPGAQPFQRTLGGMHLFEQRAHGASVCFAASQHAGGALGCA